MTTATIREPIGSFILDAAPTALRPERTRAADSARAIGRLMEENRRLQLAARRAVESAWFARRQRRAMAYGVGAAALVILGAFVVALAVI